MSTPQETFWKWFEAHECELFDFESDQERLFGELHRQLERVHKDLCFEFGPKSEWREFVISADGLREAFPAVSSLVAAAPKIERWRITAFRPRRTSISGIQIGDICLEPTDVHFTLLTNGSEIGIQLFIPGMDEDNRPLRQIGYLMLDEALGEFDVETKVGPIQMLSPEAPRTAGRHPLPELASHFDELSQRTGRQRSSIN